MRIADAALRQQLGIEKGRVKIRPEGYTWHEELTLTDSSALVGYFDFYLVYTPIHDALAHGGGRQDHTHVTSGGSLE